MVGLTEKLAPLDPQITSQESTNPEFATIHKAIPLAFGAYGKHSEPAVPWLRKMLAAHVPDVRRNAAIALGDIGAEAVESLSDLGKRARDRQEISDVSHACSEAINKIKGVGE